ncbi:riboflavin kinase [Rhodotorula diobovata]|uniref:Riboflavin kinase n=1 Tax=Rhodotorula diobovata TaxID=5288 RepID=A0A5C5FPA3_9BASI|nr:riboflavin kinase [Rhodotorula diobovata]
MASGSSLVERTPALEHDPSLVRPDVAGPDSGPPSPYPVYLDGWVTRGFGRGSKDLGCPTANLPDSSIAPYAATLSTGVYFGFARVLDPASAPRDAAQGAFSPDAPRGVHDEVHPMVMSIGWNPFYNNSTRTAEVHILHAYPADFYGKELRVVMLGFIRPEYNYSSLDALIKDINHDKLVALHSVSSPSRPAYASFQDDPFFFRPSTLEPPSEDPAKPRVKPGDETGQDGEA